MKDFFKRLSYVARFHCTKGRIKGYLSYAASSYADTFLQVMGGIFVLIAAPIAMATRILQPIVWVRVALRNSDVLAKNMREYPNPKDHPSYK